MKLLTEAQKKQLLENGQRPGKDYYPVVKLFHPCGAATWLLTELMDDEDTAFGLCDLGLGCPELGYVSLNELRSVRRMGLGVERDLSFSAKKSIREYAKEADLHSRIVA